MNATRRTALTLAAGALAAPAVAHASGPYAALAAYSAERSGVSLLVQQGGRTLFEDYPAPGAPDRAWELASATKSFCGLMAAALVQDRLLQLDERCADTLGEWRAEPRKARITLRQLLTLTSGIDGRGGRRLGNVPTYAEAIAEPAVAEPGASFSYGAVPFQIFGEIVRRKLVAARTGDADPLAYLQRRLFDPLSVRPQRWRRGADGMPHLPSGAALTARDLARIGRFVLDGGRVGGRVLLDPGALADNWRTTSANPGYGLTWWIPGPGMKGPGLRAGVAQDGARLGPGGLVRMAAGAGNQRLYLVPGRDLVVVRQARGVLEALTGRGPDWSDADFLALLPA